MERCPVCNGRTMMAQEGVKCMNSSCEGSKLEVPEEGIVTCRCGERMIYTGEDSWGQPNYMCMKCKAIKR